MKTRNCADRGSESQSRFLRLPGGAGSLKSLGTARDIPKGKIFVKPGDEVTHCYVVQKGCVIAYGVSNAGNDRIYAIALENALLLEVCAFLGTPSPVYLKAVKDSEVAAIPRPVFLDSLQHVPEAAVTVIESVCRKYTSMTEQIREMTCRDAAWRLCNLFVIFANAYGERAGDSIVIKEKINQQLLSDLLGINRVTTVRIIAAMKARGLLAKTAGYYRLPSLSRLAAYMDEIEEKSV